MARRRTEDLLTSVQNRLCQNNQGISTMIIPRAQLVAGLFVAAALSGCAMTGKTVHATANVYPAIGPYSQMVQSGNTYYLSGVIPLNKAGNAVEGASIEEQTRLVLTYIGEVLRAQGMTYDNVVMSNVFMKDLNDFAKMNGVDGEFFKTNPPARATVEVARLPRDVRIEIAVIASK
jgi:2-iminobutanoate/2-iminopropanoate deaminase